MTEHTDSELVLLGILATGLESRQQQTNGLHIGEEAGRKALEDSLELQQTVPAVGDDPVAHPAPGATSG